MARRRRLATLFLLVFVALALVAGCSGDDDDGEAAPTGTAGGQVDLPGALPEGVEFEDAPDGGVPAPDFTSELVDGTPFTASELWADRPTVVIFTASWCETCADVHREVAEVVDDHDGAVALLGVVGTDDAAAALDYAEELDLGYPIAVGDEDVWLDWAAREPPLVVLVGPGGTVLRGWPGGVKGDVLAEQLDELVSSSDGG